MKHEAGLSTWVEIKQAVKLDRVLFLPIGSTEANGPHLPVITDSIIANYFAKELAKRVNGLSLPPIYYGCSEAFKGFCGTVWIHSSTLQAIVEDICQSIAKHGFRHLIIINNHGSNEPAIENAIRFTTRHYNLKIISVWPSRIINQMASKSIFKERPEVIGHGGQPMTSIIQAIMPDAVRLDLAPKGANNLKSSGQFNTLSSTSALFQGYKVNRYIEIHEVSDNSQTGDARAGSSEIGQKLLDELLDWGIKLVNAFLNEDKNE
jgi:creatinine amidohydrolase